MKRELSDCQARVLTYVREAVAHGTAPTYREIATRFGWSSTKAAVDHVDRLAKKGFLHVHRGRARGIEVLDSESKGHKGVVPVPVQGSIAAGRAIEATETRAGRVLVDRELLGRAASDRLFAVRVRGDSMSGRGIHDGDIAIADADADAKVGDVVVALIDNESTIKTLAQGREGSYLKAENPRYPDLFPVAQLRIQGVVRTLIRRLG